MNKTYKRGDVREDGYVFLRYQTTYKGTVCAVFISPEALARQKQTVKSWKDANPAKVKLHRDKWRKANPEKVNSAMRNWRNKNKGE